MLQIRHQPMLVVGFVCFLISSFHLSESTVNISYFFELRQDILKTRIGYYFRKRKSQCVRVPKSSFLTFCKTKFHAKHGTKRMDAKTN